MSVSTLGDKQTCETVLSQQSIVNSLPKKPPMSRKIFTGGGRVAAGGGRGCLPAESRQPRGRVKRQSAPRGGVGETAVRMVAKRTGRSRSGGEEKGSHGREAKERGTSRKFIERHPSEHGDSRSAEGPPGLRRTDPARLVAGAPGHASPKSRPRCRSPPAGLLGCRLPCRRYTRFFPRGRRMFPRPG